MHLTWENVILEQFFEASLYLKGSGDKISLIAEKSGYPQGLRGVKNGPKMGKIGNTEKIMKKNEKK